MPKRKTAIKARGRNGEFVPSRVYVQIREFGSPETSVEIMSRRLGWSSPISVTGKHDAVVDLFRRIYHTLLDGKSCTLAVPTGVPRLGKEGDDGLRMIRLKGAKG